MIPVHLALVFLDTSIRSETVRHSLTSHLQANQYAKNRRVAFELMNEPNDSCGNTIDVLEWYDADELALQKESKGVNI